MANENVSEGHGYKQGMGGMLADGVNFLLGAGGVATGATALGTKCSEHKVREIIAQTHGCGYNNGCGNGYGYNNCGYNGYNNCGNNGCGNNGCGNNGCGNNGCGNNGCGNGYNHGHCGHNGCFENQHVTHFENNIISENTRLKAEKYDDAKLDAAVCKITEKMDCNFKGVYENLGRLNTEAALEKQAAHYDRIITNNRIDCLAKDVNTANANVYAYVDCNFIKARKQEPLYGCMKVNIEPRLIPTESLRHEHRHDHRRNEEQETTQTQE